MLTSRDLSTREYLVTGNHPPPLNSSWKSMLSLYDMYGKNHFIILRANHLQLRRDIKQANFDANTIFEEQSDSKLHIMEIIRREQKFGIQPVLPMPNVGNTEILPMVLFPVLHFRPCYLTNTHLSRVTLTMPPMWYSNMRYRLPAMPLSPMKASPWPRLLQLAILNLRASITAIQTPRN